MGGRPRKPKQQHIIDGTFRKDRHNTVEYTKLDTIPLPPEYFSEYAKTLYFKNATELLKKRMLNATDIESLVTYCYSAWVVDDLQRRMAEIMQDELFDPTSRDYTTLIMRWNQTATLMRQFGDKFGFNPTDAGKIQIPDAPKEGGMAKLLEIKNNIK